jgi:hypothetical protein
MLYLPVRLFGILYPKVTFVNLEGRRFLHLTRPLNFGELRYGEVRRIALIRSLRTWRSRQPDVWFLTNRSGEPHLIGVFANPLQLDIT